MPSIRVVVTLVLALTVGLVLPVAAHRLSSVPKAGSGSQARRVA
jgi:hypothetical protein